MLSPDSRILYTTAVAPPDGYRLDCAIGTTYSLDPLTLLTVPLYIAFEGRMNKGETDELPMYESLRRAANRIMVFSQKGRLKIPEHPNTLYGMLESMVAEVQAPNPKGVFHPKIWLFRYLSKDEESDPAYRLLVLTRNITNDRCWDLAVQLDGVIGGRRVAANRDLGEFIAQLPALTTKNLPQETREWIADLAEGVRFVQWELPEGFEDHAFHVLGMNGKAKAWRPDDSDELAIISPFVSASALEHLSRTTNHFRALISRSEELDKLGPIACIGQDSIHILSDAAETEDGEEIVTRDSTGLHAKAYIAKRGWDTIIYLGSANATNAAILNSANVEFLIQLTGKRSKVDGMEDLLGKDGLGNCLLPYNPGQSAETDNEEMKARETLEHLRDAISALPLAVRCVGSNEKWKLELINDQASTFSIDGSTLKAWPITLPDADAVDVTSIFNTQVMPFSTLALANITGIIGFEAGLPDRPEKLRFALNLPLLGLPEGREAAILGTFLNNQNGFLRYLLLLLGEEADDGGDDPPPGGMSSKIFSWGSGGFNTLALLEEMVRAFSREPERLIDIDAIINRLSSTEEGKKLIPNDFLELWAVFKEAREGKANA